MQEWNRAVFYGRDFGGRYGMAEKWHKNGIGNANDRGNKICYTDTVYKWVPRNPLVFLYEWERSLML